jgi:hypothetical protein
VDHVTQPEPQRVQPIGPPGFTRRNLAMTILMVVLMLLLAVGQWLTIQAGQDVGAALAGSTRTGPVDIQYKGMGFSRDHVLVARYEIYGIADVSTARWHAKPWGHVELAP